MPTTAEMEQLRSLCQRWCAISAGEQHHDGYFAFYGGGKSGARDAKVLADRVPFGPVDDTTTTVIERCDMLIAEGFGPFWVRVYAKGSSNHAASVKVLADPHAEQPDDPLGDGKADTLGQAHAKVVLGLARGNYEMMSLNQSLHERLAEAQTAQALYQLAALNAHDASNAAAMTEAIRQIGPTLAEVAPVLVAEMLRRMREPEPQPAPAGVAPAVDAAPAVEVPSEPAAKVDYHLTRLEQDTAALHDLAKSFPEVMVRARILRIHALLRRYGVQFEEPPADAA